jgi:N6-adenosine-specific RNA methylase IME4
LMGDLPRVELFCRFPKDGWDVWGNQIEATVEVGMSGSSST